MELVAPAGNVEKLHFVSLYGADSAYIGLPLFSLRAKADNLQWDQYKALGEAKGTAKVFCAINSYFTDRDLKLLVDHLEPISLFNFDGFIVSDLGAFDILSKRFPEAEYHLSTQANCTNSGAAKAYLAMGFKRIVPARESSLADISAIKMAAPELEIEAFGHGAMCVAYSGRCLLSAVMTDRSGNRGDCSHSCRWKYDLMGLPVETVLREEERPDQYYPIYEHSNGGTSILSSKDLSMIEHLGDMKAAGVDAIKIEGRMKSSYYAAILTRAYRKAIDSLEGKISSSYGREFMDDVYSVSHREYYTGFYFDHDHGSSQGQTSLEKPYKSSHVFLASLWPDQSQNGTTRYRIDCKNPFYSHETVEIISPDKHHWELTEFRLTNANGAPVERAVPTSTCYLELKGEATNGLLLRKPKGIAK